MKRRLAAFIFLSISSVAQAATCTSLSAGTWASAGRWSCGHIPVAADTVVINSNITLDTNRTIAGISVNNGFTFSGNNRNLTVSGPVVINGVFNTGGGDLTTTAGGSLTIAASGTFNFNNGNASINGDIVLDGILFSGGDNLQMTGAGTSISGTGSVQNTTIEIDATGVTVSAGSNLIFDANSDITVASNVSPASLTINGTIDGTAITGGNRIIRVSTGGTLTVGTTGVIDAPLARLDVRTGATATNNGTIDIGQLRGRTGTPAPIFTQGANSTLTINTSVCPAANPCTFNATATGNTVNYGAGVTIYPTTYANLGGTVTCPLPVGVVVTGSNPCSTIHHVEVRFTGSALTCQPNTLTIVACGDAACTTTGTTGVSGTISASGATTNFPAGNAYSIAAGQSQTTLQAWTTQTGTATFAATGGGNPSTCNINGAGNCSLTAADSGLFVTAVDHVSATQSTVTVQAVEKSTNAAMCVPSFTGNQTIGVACDYAAPATGTKQLNFDFAGIGCSNGVTYSYTKAFDSTGSASFTVSYPDVGRIGLTVSHYGSGSSAGLVMTGTASFVAVPASFDVVLPVGKQKAGASFVATVSALNSLGAVTPNFGQEGETTSITYLLDTPSAGANPALGTQPFTFTNGVASISTSWGEVGIGRLRTALASGAYLGSAVAVPSTDSNLSFMPDHFKTTVTDGCAGCGNTYSGQAFKTTVRAENALGQVTTNYASGLSCTTALTAQDVLGVTSPNGAISTASIAGGDWVAGVVSNWATTFSFTSAPTPYAPQDVFVNAAEVGCDGAASAVAHQGKTNVVQGRIKVGNSYGSDRFPIDLPASIQYWDGAAWKLASTDYVTTISGITTSNWVTLTPGSITPTASPATVIAGASKLRLPQAGVGSVDVSISAPSYLASSSGKATFGIYAGSKHMIYLREAY